MVANNMHQILNGFCDWASRRPVALAGLSFASWVVYFVSILQHGYLKRSSSWASDCHMGIFTSDSSCETDLKGFLKHGRYGECSEDGLSHYYALAVFSCFAMVPMTVAALVSVYDAKGEQEYNKLKMIAHACGSFFTCLTWILMATLYTRKSSNYCYTSLKSEFDLYWSFGFIVVVSVLQGVLAFVQFREDEKVISVPVKKPESLVTDAKVSYGTTEATTNIQEE